jgi:LysM repeat protein
VSWQAYIVRKGEQPAQIAARHGITLARLQEVNGVRRIGPGTTLLVPASGGQAHLPDLPAPPLSAVRAAPAKVSGKPATAKRGTAHPTMKTVAKTAAKPATAARPAARKSAPAKPAPNKPATTAQR